MSPCCRRLGFQQTEQRVIPLRLAPGPSSVSSSTLNSVVDFGTFVLSYSETPYLRRYTITPFDTPP